MEILLADSLGFCMGVKRAVDLAYHASKTYRDQPLVTLGPLIHNAQETERLAKDGIVATDLAHVPEDGVVIVRTHGVGASVYVELKSRGLRVLDATCPYVLFSQRKAIDLKRDGYTVVIVGYLEHPEVQGILGHIGGEGLVIKSAGEAAELPIHDRIGVIAQTTISPTLYQEVVGELRGRAREIKVCETICSATEENQDAIRRLARETDFIYVIGGRHSSNSNKLVEAARAHCPRVKLIETESEIQAEELTGVSRVGVSAGASTPDWVVARVIHRLNALANNPFA